MRARGIGENKDGNDTKGIIPQAGGDVKEDITDASAANYPAEEEKVAEGSLNAVMNTIATFLSIIGVFTAVTCYVDKSLSKRRKRGDNIG